MEKPVVGGVTLKTVALLTMLLVEVALSPQATAVVP
jgi:hypothetical protein